MRKTPLVAAMVVLSTATACGNFTSFQTARALKAHEWKTEAQAAFVAGVDGGTIDLGVRTGLGAGLEVGAHTGFANLLGADIKWQFMHQEDPDVKDGSPKASDIPFSAALNAGAGIGAWANYYFGQAIVSRRWGNVEPYLSYRYQVIDIDVDLDDDDDLDDFEDTWLDDFFDELNDVNIGVHHIFFGAEMALGDGGIYLTIETSAAKASGGSWSLGDAGIGIGARW